MASDPDDPAVPLDGTAIRALLEAVAAELDSTAPEGAAPAEVVLVGGALLAISGLRDATTDVDTARPVTPELAAAVARVAERTGLAPKWLNDHAKPFLPATFRLADCSEVQLSRALVVYAAPLDQVFLMKINAARAQDLADLDAMWPRCSFEDAEQAVIAYRAAYPYEAHDEYLTDWLRQVIGIQ